MAGLGLLGALAAAAPAAGAGPASLSSLAEGQVVAEHFRLRRIYQGPAGEPRGARFLHATGMPVDVLFFPSAPRLSLYARTLPVSDKGEPHTGEHLLLGKGRTGRQLNGLMEMRLGEHSAETHPDLVCYHFRAAVGPDDFFELVSAMLTALLRPDYTDEEIRREVAHVEAVPGPGGSLRLEEKGTVYNEMVSTVQEPNSVIWQKVRALGYGAGHPLAREAGGLPEGIRGLSPAEVRAFHAANYHLGANMAMVAVVPLGWSVEDFLGRLHGVLTRAEPQPPSLEPAAMPAPRPASPARIHIGKYPAADKSSTQGVVLSWPPLARLTLREEFRINLLMSVLAGGQTSLLHRDLVDGKTRLLETGATGVGTYLDDGVLPLPTISLGGLRLEAITRPTLTRLREQIQRRIRWLADLPAGSPELVQVSERARALLKSQRRSVLKALDDAPGFGSGNAAAGWHRYLDTLEREGGFRAPLLPEAVFAELDRDLQGGQNPWRPIAERAGLLGRPHVIATLPDPTLLARDRARREARIRRKLRELETRFGERTEQGALSRFKEEFDGATRAIEARNDEVRLPAFLANPPLGRDDAPFLRGQLPGGVPVVRTQFDSTVFTDLGLAFDLRGLTAADEELLPLLGTLDDLGVTTRQGEVLDYDTTEERVRSEVYGVGFGLSMNPRTRRIELTLGGSASSPEEITRLAGSMDAFLNRPRVDLSVRGRLVDVVRGRIQSLRNLFQTDPDSWAGQIAGAIDYQDQPLYLALASPFTALYHLSRMRWRLRSVRCRAPAPRSWRGRPDRVRRP